MSTSAFQRLRGSIASELRLAIQESTGLAGTLLNRGGSVDDDAWQLSLRSSGHHWWLGAASPYSAESRSWTCDFSDASAAAIRSGNQVFDELGGDMMASRGIANLKARLLQIFVETSERIMPRTSRHRILSNLRLRPSETVIKHCFDCDQLRRIPTGLQLGDSCVFQRSRCFAWHCDHGLLAFFAQWYVTSP